MWQGSHEEEGAVQRAIGAVVVRIHAHRDRDLPRRLHYTQ